MLTTLPLSALPAYAAGTGKAMQLVGTGNPSGGIEDQDHIYLGTKDDTHYTWTDAVPYWRVLDADEMNTGDAGMFLLSENLIGNNPGGSYGNIYFNQDLMKGNAWQKSDAQAWCGDFLTNVFSGQEQAAIAGTTKSDGAKTYTDTEYSCTFDYGASNNILSGDPVFFLSAEEADSSAYGFTNNASRTAKYESSNAPWWLRSPYSDDINRAGIVWFVGRIDHDSVVRAYAARPAFNLDLSSVLFTAAAEGGKSSGVADADSLKAVSAYSGKAWKLTIKDSARSGFKASYDSRSGDLITIKYGGASAGTGEYISAIIVNDSGVITYYGNLASAAAGDDITASVNLAGKYNDGDTLYVFHEQCNGDKKTDYASELQEIKIPELYTVKVTAGANMTQASGSGDLTQTVEDSTAIKDVVFEASAGYYFPDSYSTAAVNGISVTRNSETKVTVSGIPTADVEFALPDASEKSATTWTVSFDKNGGSGTMEDVTGVSGEYTLPKCIFTAPEDKAFDYWLVDGKEYAEGDPITVEADTTVTAQWKDVPPAHVHDLKLVEEKEATCTEDGNTAYYVCDGCGLWFEDATALVEITDESSVVIKALGHKWDSGVVTKEATYTTEGIRTFTCLNDKSHTKTELIPKKERQSSGDSDEDSSSPVVRGVWDQDASGWHYRENGALVKGAWRYLPYNGLSYWYYFDEAGVMKTGWLLWNGNWYYLWPVSDGWMGRMVTGWQQIEGKWYYFETAPGKDQGRMYRSERTPDGYYVGPDVTWDGNPADKSA